MLKGRKAQVAELPMEVFELSCVLESLVHAFIHSSCIHSSFIHSFFMHSFFMHSFSCGLALGQQWRQV